MTNEIYSRVLVVTVLALILGGVCGLVGTALYYEFFVIDHLSACDPLMGGERYVWE